MDFGADGRVIESSSSKIFIACNWNKLQYNNDNNNNVTITVLYAIKILKLLYINLEFFAVALFEVFDWRIPHFVRNF